MNNEGGSAFPHTRPVTSAEQQHFYATNPPHVPAPGVVYEVVMTLRDYFAAQALVRITAMDKTGAMSPDITATACYAMADAMLRERAK